MRRGYHELHSVEDEEVAVEVPDATSEDELPEAIIVGEDKSRGSGERRYVKVKTLQETVHEIDLHAGLRSVGDLKAALSPLCGMAVDEQRLIFRGRFLDNGSELTAAGVTHEACLHLIPCPQPRHEPPAAVVPSVPAPGGSGGVVDDYPLGGVDIELGVMGRRFEDISPLPGGEGPGGGVHLDPAHNIAPHVVLVWQMRVRCLAFIVVFRWGLGLITAATIIVQPAAFSALGGSAAGTSADPSASSYYGYYGYDGAASAYHGGRNATSGAASDAEGATGAEALELLVCMMGVFTGMLGFKAAQTLDLRLAQRFFNGLMLLAVSSIAVYIWQALSYPDYLAMRNGGYGATHDGARGNTRGESYYANSFLGMLINLLFWFCCIFYAKQFRDVLQAHYGGPSAAAPQGPAGGAAGERRRRLSGLFQGAIARLRGWGRSPASATAAVADHGGASVVAAPLA